MTGKWHVTLFLNEFKKAWPPRCFVVIRDKNKQSLVELNLTPELRKEIILSLTPQDYISGPEPDEDKPGDEVWIFGKKLSEADGIYIKLKIFTVSGKHIGKCISFHRAEKTLLYPFR